MEDRAMFELGKKYRITMTVPSGEGWTDESGVWTLAAQEGTLIKLQNPQLGKDKIVNTASWHFVSAELA